MNWCETFSVGIQGIDDQHKKLFELIAKTGSVSFSDDVETLHDEIVRVLVKLNLYTIYHFETEERLLALNGFSALEDHKKEHAKFVEKLESLRPEHEEIKSKETLDEIVNFLQMWIENHILKSDFKYKDLLADKIADGTYVEYRKSEPFKFPEELDIEE